VSPEIEAQMMPDRPLTVASHPRRTRPLVLALTLLAASGCSLRTMAVKTVANSLSDTGDVFTRDDDPDLVRDATPFALKLYESLLESVPTHVPLLIATCGGFTQYGYAFVESEADAVEAADRSEAVALRARALKHYLRARAYCLRAMNLRFGRGTSEALLQDPAAAVARARRDDVPLLYWSAASWGAAIALGIDRPDLAVDFPTVRALADRALALDPHWNRGAIHELMISLDSLPEALGGNPERAREHFRAAVEIQKGLSPGPYVALATGVAVSAQDRAEFERLLKEALAIDPEKDPSNRLVTLVAQRRARVLLERVDDKFLK
jgi:predicted anti-sigma-YlaC factor YlaD